MADATDSLRRVPLFAQVDKKHLKRLEQRMQDRTFPEGHEIASEGESGVGFFLIEDGTAVVSVGGETRRELGPGDWFGEIALIDEGPRSATVTAGSDLRCRGMSAWEFRPFVQEHPEVAWPLLQALVRRLRDSESRQAPS
jgi:CRP-like cAMP-binding protein